MPAASENAYNLTAMTEMPSDAAARSLVRTAINRRADRPRLRFATMRPVTVSTQRQKTA